MGVSFQEKNQFENPILGGRDIMKYMIIQTARFLVRHPLEGSNIKIYATSGHLFFANNQNSM